VSDYVPSRFFHDEAKVARMISAQAVSEYIPSRFFHDETKLARVIQRKWYRFSFCGHLGTPKKLARVIQRSGTDLAFADIQVHRKKACAGKAAQKESDSRVPAVARFEAAE
jgi:hypothetical protein